MKETERLSWGKWDILSTLHEFHLWAVAHSIKYSLHLSDKILMFITKTVALDARLLPSMLRNTNNAIT